jgi:hypothetical protein
MVYGAEPGRHAAGGIKKLVDCILLKLKKREDCDSYNKQKEEMLSDPVLIPN